LIEPPVGYDIIEYDFAGQEYRWMGVLSGDEVILQMCQPGEDGHSFMGARIAGADYHEMMAAVAAGDKQAKLFRQGGKVSNLSLQYRMSYRQMYQDTYRSVPIYWQDSIKLARAKGYAETLAGRRVQLKGTWRGKAAYPLEQTAINYRIQGTGADQKYLAMLILKNELPRFNGHFYFDLHDGLYSIVPKGKSEAAFWHLKPLISNLPYKRAWGVDLPIAFPVDGKLGPSWGELVEMKS
jgi:DNA polymerase-1